MKYTLFVKTELKNAANVAFEVTAMQMFFFFCSMEDADFAAKELAENVENIQVLKLYKDPNERHIFD